MRTTPSKTTQAMEVRRYGIWASSGSPLGLISMTDCWSMVNMASSHTKARRDAGLTAMFKTCTSPPMRIEATVMPLRQRIRSAPEHTKILSLAWNLPLEHACGKRRRGSTRVAKSSKASLSRRHRFRQLKQQQHSNLGRLTDPRQDVGCHLCGIVRLGGIRQRRNRWRRFVLLFPIIDDKPYDRKQGQDDLLIRGDAVRSVFPAKIGSARAQETHDCAAKLHLDSETAALLWRHLSPLVCSCCASLLERVVTRRHVRATVDARDEVSQRVVARTFGARGAAQVADGPHHQE